MLHGDCEGYVSVIGKLSYGKFGGRQARFRRVLWSARSFCRACRQEFGKPGVLRFSRYVSIFRIKLIF